MSLASMSGKNPSAGVMNASRIASIIQPPYESISRTGRNEAINSSVKMAAANRISANPSPRGSGRSKKNAEPFGGGEMFDSGAFGVGERTDKGSGHEMCSSPRSHPLVESYERDQYEANRLQVFHVIKDEVEMLPVLDEGGISEKASKALKSGKGILGSHRQELDDVDSLQDDEEAAERREQEEKEKASMAEVAMQPRPPQQQQQQQQQQTQQLSPGRSKHKNQDPSHSASFMSPDRWKQPSPRTTVPAVGHYRPKHEATQYATTHGYIASPGKTTPRRAKDRDFSHSILPSQQAARERIEREEQGLNEPASPTNDLDDLTSKPKKAEIPQPGKNSTSAFKSKIPQCSGIKNFSAAPDQWYYTTNDEFTLGALPRASVKFDKQTPRQPLAKETDVPEAYYNVSGALKNEHTPVNMERQTARPQLKLAHINDTPFYEIDRANNITKPKIDHVDFSKTSPRKTVEYKANNVSVEEAENYKDSSLTTKRVPALNMDRLKTRSDQTISHLNDLIYDVNSSMTSPRLKGANIRVNDPGHQPLWMPSITDNCSYNPQLSAVRPKGVRAVDFDKDTPRKHMVAGLHDLTYDVKETLTTPRKQGDPMIATHVNRDKREKILSPRKVQTETNYKSVDLDKIRTVTKSNVDFAKQITKEKQFAGRGIPSESFKLKNPTAPPVGSYEWAK